MAGWSAEWTQSLKIGPNANVPRVGGWPPAGKESAFREGGRIPVRATDVVRPCECGSIGRTAGFTNEAALASGRPSRDLVRPFPRNATWTGITHPVHHAPCRLRCTGTCRPATGFCNQTLSLLYCPA